MSSRQAVSSPLCLALDSEDLGRLEELAAATERDVGVFKVGLTAFVAGGPDFVRRVARRRPVFLDLKLHDIPAQVAGAVRAARASGASFVTVHAAGGRAMLEAAVEAAGDRLKVLAVTVLTSLDDAALDAIGMSGPAEAAVMRLAEMALDAGAPGLVCSPREARAIRARWGPAAAGGPLLVVPGVRAAGSAGDDQARTLSAREALDAGADLVVVGRPVTEAADPPRAAAELVRGLAS